MSQPSLITKIINNPHRTFNNAKHKLNNKIEDLLLGIKRRQNKQEIVNEKEIRIVGLRRTGNHGIINWIRKQHAGKVWHLNNITTERNPYRVLYLHYKKEHLNREAKGNSVKKDCLLYSFEDYPLEKIVRGGLEKKHDLYLGKSRERYDVLILRDPFNLFASRIKKNYMNVKDENWTIVDLWISYAREYLGETDYLKNNKVVVNYNRWATDIEYRQHIASQLKVEFSDAGINDVKSEGGGSSFDRTSFQGQANKMDVLNRWKIFSDDPSYRALLKNNRELIDYSERIFGHIPGTEVLGLF